MISLSHVVTHARTASSIGTLAVYLSGRKPCRALGCQYPRRKGNFGESFRRARAEKRGNERTRGGSQRTGEESTSSSLARESHVARRYYRRSHVGAQRPIIVFPPDRPVGKRAWEWFYLEWITGRIVRDNGRLRRRRAVTTITLITRDVVIAVTSHLATSAWNSSSLLTLYSPARMGIAV